MSLDTSRFLDQVKMKATLPTGRYTDQEILDIAYDILLSDVQPFLISLKQEFYTKKSNLTVSDGYNTYPINSRALGMALRELKLDSENLRQISPEDTDENSSNDTSAYYFEGSNIILYPTPTSSATLTQTYFQRISKPVLTTDCAVVTSIDTSTGIVTATTPSTWTTSDTFDIVSRLNGNDTLAKDLSASAISSTTITFTASDLPSTFAVGDYIALAGETPYIQVPDDAIPLVQQLTVTDLMEALGDQNALQISMQKAEKLRVGLTRVMSIRNQGETIRLMPSI